jgi:hypothetical protein
MSQIEKIYPNKGNHLAGSAENEANLMDSQLA